MRAILYRLNKEGVPVPMKDHDRDDVLKWGRWMEGRTSQDRIVKQTHGHGLFISTVFLGVDYAFQGPPICWETIVVPLQEDGSVDWGSELDMDRCTGDREQAEAMHEAMCEKHEVNV